MIFFFRANKGIVFFFPRPWTLVIHSFKSENRVFFFSAKRKKPEKKNTSLFFFFPGKVHRSFIRIFDGFLFFLIKVGCVFFFRNFAVFFCVFFFLEKFTSHSFIQIFGRKKKTAFSFIHSKFLKNAQKRTFPCKKKKIRHLWIHN